MIGRDKESAHSPRDERELRSGKEKHEPEADGNPVHLLRNPQGKCGN